MLQAAGAVAADRLQLVRGLQRVGDVADRQARSRQPRRIGDDLDLARIAREHFDVADAGHARQRRPHHVERVVVQVRRRQRRRSG